MNGFPSYILPATRADLLAGLLSTVPADRLRSVVHDLEIASGKVVPPAKVLGLKELVSADPARRFESALAFFRSWEEISGAEALLMRCAIQAAKCINADEQLRQLKAWTSLFPLSSVLPHTWPEYVREAELVDQVNQSPAGEMRREALLDLCRFYGDLGVDYADLRERVSGIGADVPVIPSRDHDADDRQQVAAEDSPLFRKFMLFATYRSFPDVAALMGDLFSTSEHFFEVIESFPAGYSDGILRVADAGCGFQGFIRDLKRRLAPTRPVRTMGIDLIDWTRYDLPTAGKRRWLWRRINQSIDQDGADIWHRDWAPDLFLEGNLSRVGLPEPCDLIFMIFVLPYLEDPLRGIANLYNQLRIGGRLYLSPAWHSGMFIHLDQARHDLVLPLFYAQLRSAGINVLSRPGPFEGGRSLFIERRDERRLKILVSGPTSGLFHLYSGIKRRDQPLFELTV